MERGRKEQRPLPRHHVSAALPTTVENGRDVPDYGKRTEFRAAERLGLGEPAAKEALPKIYISVGSWKSLIIQSRSEYKGSFRYFAIESYCSIFLPTTPKLALLNRFPPS